MTEDTIERVDSNSRRQSRDVTYSSGKWSQLSSLMPRFELADFRAGESEPANPHLKAVVRLPLKSFERRIPVGVVSNSYPLTQHEQIAHQCFSGVRALGVQPEELKCDLGLTELGEWMNLRIYFPPQFDYVMGEDDRLGLRVECFNSVDGSSRLVLFLGWIRFICSNGMIIGETVTTLRDTHDKHLDLDQIPKVIQNGLNKVKMELERLERWENTGYSAQRFKDWINKDVAEAFNKKAACRVFHICNSGRDVEIANPFAPGEATEKPVRSTLTVPGSPEIAQSLFDVSQALSWVATRRVNAEERLDWQARIPALLTKLSVN